MIELLISLAKMILMLLPFGVLCWWNSKANLKRKIRYKQFLMPIVALVLCIVATFLLSEIYDLAVLCLLRIDDWIRSFGDWVLRKLPQALQSLGTGAHGLADLLEGFIKKLNLNFWAFYVANALILLAYVLVKPVILLLMKGLFRDGGLFQMLAGIFYEYDEEDDRWDLKPRFGQARTFLKTMYVAAVLVGAIGVLVSSRLYLNELLTAVYYPVFSVIILGEVCAFLNGLTKKERKRQEGADDEEARKSVDYSSMMGVLRSLFGDKLDAENNDVCEADTDGAMEKELLERLEESDAMAEEAYGKFMQARVRDGLDIDANYLLSGRQLLNGQSVLFNDPFYYDLIPYIFFPMDRALLRHQKVLVILGRHGTEENVSQWVREGLASVSHIPDLWKIGVLEGREDPEEEVPVPDVGILTRSSVHDLRMHERNRDFFDQVGFVVLIEPSRLVTTAQVGLNSLVRHCRRDRKKRLVFCSADKNCDGLLDALSHILMVSLQEVSATNHHKGTASCMVWDADGEHLQHRLLPNISRYLGMGTELSFAALKEQIPETRWYGGDSFPVVDIQWIARQYYYDLLKYAKLPPSQEMMDRVFRVSTDMWSAPVKAEQYITVEDESFNMFEMRRSFATRATEQGFINVICPEYLLKDYMADNESIFRTDPKAIPYITADYARTVRNVVLRLCLRMSTGLVPERDIVRELVMVDRDATDPLRSLWQQICLSCGHLGHTTEDLDGRLLLHRQTPDGEEVFTSEVLVHKRRFDMDTGRMEDMYCITNSRFIKVVLGDLAMAEYVAEDDNGERQYLGTELRGHVYQKYLPGQFFTFGGKYYEMLRVTSEGKVVVRRASEHIHGRPAYRQVRDYYIAHPVDSQTMGECKDMGTIRICRQYADIRVQSPAYWKLDRYNDLAGGRRVAINGVPDRIYHNKALVRVDLRPGENLPEGTVQTLTLLINEVLRTLLAENQDYLVAVCGGEASLPNTYSLYGEEGFEPDGNSIYLIEDSQMDIGLLDTVERNLDRIFAIICDYLQWHEEKLASEEPKPEGDEGTEGGEPGQDGPTDADGPDGAEPGADGKKEGFFRRILRKIREFFRKLFRRKKKEAEPAPEAGTEPETDTEPVGEPGVPDDEPLVPLDPAPSEEQTVEEEAPMESRALFSRRLADAEPTTDPGDVPEGEVETGAGSDGDTVDYEKEKILKPGGKRERLAYKDRFYLRYGSDELAQSLQIQGVRDLLTGLGYSNSALTQARKGKDVADLVERTFVPGREGAHYCDFCGCDMAGMDFDVLGDGRERCPDCARTAVKSLDEFVALHDAVLRNMKMLFGVKINAPVHVQMVNSRKLHRKLGRTFVPTGNSDGRVLGVAIKDGNGYSILVENGAPKLMSTMTMVHEMTHIWQYLNWDGRDIKKTYGKDELEVYEGMAKWVEIQYAYLMGETATAKREEMITRHRQDEYGRGFVKYADKYPLTIGSSVSGKTPFDEPKRPL